MSVKWLRPEFKGRERELETRADFEKRTGITAQNLSSRFTSYADRKPKIVKKFGKLKYFVATELDEFVDWISKNSGTRSDADIRQAEIARLQDAIEECRERADDHKANMVKAEKDEARYKRKLDIKKEELAFFEQRE